MLNTKILYPSKSVVFRIRCYDDDEDYEDNDEDAYNANDDDEDQDNNDDVDDNVHDDDDDVSVQV